jgi:hypothetical protein
VAAIIGTLFEIPLTVCSTEKCEKLLERLAGATGLEPAASCVTGVLTN